MVAKTGASTKKRASKSGNPAVRASAGASSVSDFKKKKGGVFELPSGARMRIKNPGGLSIFLKGGVIPNSLMSIVNDAIEKGKEPDMSKFVDKDGGMNTDNMNDMLALLDQVTVACAVEPSVMLSRFTEENPPPTESGCEIGDEIPELYRDDEQLYTDELEEEDKMFLFQWVTGGTADVAQFRKELEQHVGTLSGGAKVARPAKRAPARKR